MDLQEKKRLCYQILQRLYKNGTRRVFEGFFLGQGLSSGELDELLLPEFEERGILSFEKFPELVSDSEYADLYCFKFNSEEIVKSYEALFPESEQLLDDHGRFHDLRPEEVSFDENRGAIVIRGKSCPMSGQIATRVCQALFSREIGHRFTTLDLEEAVDSESDSATQSGQRIYDAVRRINSLVNKSFGISGIIRHSSERYWLDLTDSD